MFQKGHTFIWRQRIRCQVGDRLGSNRGTAGNAALLTHCITVVSSDAASLFAVPLPAHTLIADK